jgi:hypothetical protein
LLDVNLSLRMNGRVSNHNDRTGFCYTVANRGWPLTKTTLPCYRGSGRRNADLVVYLLPPTSYAYLYSRTIARHMISYTWESIRTPVAQLIDCYWRCVFDAAREDAGSGACNTVCKYATSHRVYTHQVVTAARVLCVFELQATYSINIRTLPGVLCYKVSFLTPQLMATFQPTSPGKYDHDTAA